MRWTQSRGLKFWTRKWSNLSMSLGFSVWDWYSLIGWRSKAAMLCYEKKHPSGIQGGTKKASNYKFPRPTFFAKARATVVLHRDKQNEQLHLIRHKQTNPYFLQCKLSFVKAWTEKVCGWLFPIINKAKALCLLWHNEDWWQWQRNNFWY